MELLKKITLKSAFFKKFSANKRSRSIQTNSKNAGYNEQSGGESLCQAYLGQTCLIFFLPGISIFMQYVKRYSFDTSGDVTDNVLCSLIS